MLAAITITETDQLFLNTVLFRRSTEEYSSNINVTTIQEEKL